MAQKYVNLFKYVIQIFQGKLLAYCNAVITENDVKLVCEPETTDVLLAYLNRFVYIIYIYMNQFIGYIYICIYMNTLIYL
jgi:hypothetical protein